MSSKKNLGAAFLLVVAMGIGGLVGTIDKNSGIINKSLHRKDTPKYETQLTTVPKPAKINSITIPDYALELLKKNPQKETEIAVGDLEGDGDLDVIMGIKEKDKMGHRYTWENKGDGTFYNPRISLY